MRSKISLMAALALVSLFCFLGVFGLARAQDCQDEINKLRNDLSQQVLAFVKKYLKVKE